MSATTAQFALWLFTRFLVLLSLMIPGWSSVASDVTLFGQWMDQLALGQVPSSDMWQYPPGMALALWALGSMHLGTWGLLLLIVAGDMAILWVVRGSRGGWLWAIAALLTGPMMITHLDTVVTALAVFGLAAGTRWIRSGALLGLGASMKVWPLLLVAAYSRRDSLVRAIAGLGAYVMVGITTWLLLGGTGFVSNQRSRGLQVESLAAWPFMAARFLGAEVPLAFRNGATEVDLPIADLIAALLVPLSLILVGIIALRSWRARTSPDLNSTVGRAVLVVCVLLLTSRVLSPQFNVWLLGVVALALSVPRGWPTRGVAAVCTSVVAAQALYPHMYLDYLGGGGVGLVVQTIRLIALVSASITAWSFCREAVAQGDPENPLTQPSTPSFRARRGRR